MSPPSFQLIPSPSPPPWSPRYSDYITVKELAPIVIAAIVWWEEWGNKSVLARCDNSAVVAIVNGGSSRDPRAASLMWCLIFLAAIYEFSVQATHVRGTDNVSADALSRDNVTLFHILNPQAYPQPTQFQWRRST